MQNKQSSSVALHSEVQMLGAQLHTLRACHVYNAIKKQQQKLPPHRRAGSDQFIWYTMVNKLLACGVPYR